MRFDDRCRLTADCQDAHFLPKTAVFSAENEKKPKTMKYIFVRKRKWPKPVTIPIFGAENENEIQMVSIVI